MFVSILRQFCYGVEFIVRVAGYAAAGLMPILAAIVSFEVFSRYFLNHPTIWAFDLSLFLFGYIASLGGAYAHQQRAHITVDIFYQKVSPKTRKIFDLISFTLAIFFLLLIIYVCYDKLQDALKFDIRRQSEWAPLMFHFWIMTITASCLFVLQLSRDMLENVFSLVTGRELLGSEEEPSEIQQREKHGNILASPLCETGGE
ncbi:TRAP transporter small permease subunit [Malonomonas rubra]|uniref:TRAP transporter small permease subunit n=1 Tax=Malonomonas rubra TaxID=57040 RepID=UPI0026E937A6|nr:TRAP transporter small permease [Malonomonas rubra]